MIDLRRILVLFCFVVFSCERGKVCPVDPGGVYVYPEIPKGHSMSVQELNNFLDIPQAVINCISTEGLLESCLSYPFLSLIMTGSTPQTGYLLVSSQLRGLPELTIRPDRGEFLLKKYLSVDPMVSDSLTPVAKAEYAFKIYFFEVILSQYNNLKGFSTEQKINLSAKALSIYQSKKKDNSVYSEFHLTSTLVVLARLMELDSFPPFLDLKSQGWVEHLIQGYMLPDFINTDALYSLSHEYIADLKQKK